MSLFDTLVSEALKNQQALSPLRIVVEKELLHHDILRILSDEGMLGQLTLMGGTCLRICYGSARLSEDLDFTGGSTFDRHSLVHMGKALIGCLKAKYGLVVEISDPVRDSGKVDTWKLKIQTRPAQRNVPIQRINIDICSIRSHRIVPMMLLNPYGVDMGTSGLILQVESREEIFADKIIAFALRPNRIKNRDLWDLAWLRQRAVLFDVDLIPDKLVDHQCAVSDFLDQLSSRTHSLKSDPSVSSMFGQELARFLPKELAEKTVMQNTYWDYLSTFMAELEAQIRAHLDS